MGKNLFQFQKGEPERGEESADYSIDSQANLAQWYCPHRPITFSSKLAIGPTSLVYVTLSVLIARYSCHL